MSKGCVHDLSCILKADKEGNLAAIVEQIPTVIVSRPSGIGDIRNLFIEMAEKATYATKEHFEVFEKAHEMLLKDPSSKFQDDGVGVTIGKIPFTVKC